MMENIFVMMLALGILCGIALLFHTLIHLNMGESMMMSAASVILLLFLGSLTGTFLNGMYGIYAMAAAGIVIWIIMSVKNRKMDLKSVVTPVSVSLVILFAGSLVLYHNDFIQHIDEFHQWAAAVRYMLTHDRLPTGWDFVGGGGQYGFATSLFHLFFQKIAGYSEQNMYVSSALLAGIGFMLPFSGYKWKDWKKAAVYGVTVYIALYSLYMYGSKSLYVDVPVAAWSGGLAGWWMNRDKKRSNCLVLGSGLVLLHFFKQSAGLLMAALVGIFVLIQSLVIEKNYLENKKGIKRFRIASALMCLLVLLGSGVLLVLTMKLQPYDPVSGYISVEAEGEAAQETAEVQETGEQQWMIAGHVLPDGFSRMINTVQLSKKKATLSLNVFITRLFGAALSSKSNLSLSYIPFVLFMVVLMKLCGDLYGQKRKCEGYTLYMVFTALSYAAAVFFSYLFMFAYELSINMRSVTRYLSICCIYLFVIVLSVLLQPVQAEREKVREYVSYGILLIFAFGMNKKYIPNSTALDQTSVAGYAKINGTMKQVEKINSIITDSDRVYFICQYDADNIGGSELINAPALYYMDDQISSYLATPWRFYEGGCNIRLEEFDTLTVYNMPQLLYEGGYTYVWIHKTDEYLREKLPEVMECDTIKAKSLYRVRYENGAPAGLEYVCSLK